MSLKSLLQGPSIGVFTLDEQMPAARSPQGPSLSGGADYDPGIATAEVPIVASTVRGSEVKRPNLKLGSASEPEIWLGVNYWSRAGGPDMLLEFDAAVIEQ